LFLGTGSENVFFENLLDFWLLQKPNLSPHILIPINFSRNFKLLNQSNIDINTPIVKVVNPKYRKNALM